MPGHAIMVVGTTSGAGKSMRALFGGEPRSLDAVFDGLADFVDLHFRPGALASLAGLG